MFSSSLFSINNKKILVSIISFGLEKML